MGDILQSMISRLFLTISLKLVIGLVLEEMPVIFYIKKLETTEIKLVKYYYKMFWLWECLELERTKNNRCILNYIIFIHRFVNVP